MTGRSEHVIVSEAYAISFQILACGGIRPLHVRDFPVLRVVFASRHPAAAICFIACWSWGPQSLSLIHI